jgi:hypothetical protein
MRGLAKAKHNATLLNLVPDAVSLFEYLLILLGVSISDINGGGGAKRNNKGDANYPGGDAGGCGGSCDGGGGTKGGDGLGGVGTGGGGGVGSCGGSCGGKGNDGGLMEGGNANYDNNGDNSDNGGNNGNNDNNNNTGWDGNEIR